MCDSLVAAPAQTASGRTLYAKNSDRKPGEAQPFVQFPAAHYPRGSRLHTTHIEIAQVPETYRVMGHSPWWVWGFEHGVNEHAVAIGNHTVFSNDAIEEEPGLIGMDLVRLGLERGRSAREALEVMAGLLERHGQGGPALAPDAAGYHNSFVLADPREAWHLETSNRQWVARRVSLAAVSNHLSIGDDWEIASRHAESVAVDQGWWQAGARLDFARAYRNPHVPAHISAGRARAGGEALEAGRGAHDVARFVGMLRDHGGLGETWCGDALTPEDEAFFSVCAHSAPVHQTTASLVAELPAEPAAQAWPVWVGFGQPCLALFLPLYVDAVVPAALTHSGNGSAWSCFDALARYVDAAPQERAPRVRALWQEEARALELARGEAEARAAEERAAGDAEAANQTLTRFMQRCADRAIERADMLAAAPGA